MVSLFFSRYPCCLLWAVPLWWFLEVLVSDFAISSLMILFPFCPKGLSSKKAVNWRSIKLLKFLFFHLVHSVFFISIQYYKKANEVSNMCVKELKLDKNLPWNLCRLRLPIFPNLVNMLSSFFLLCKSMVLHFLFIAFLFVFLLDPFNTFWPRFSGVPHSWEKNDTQKINSF